MHKAAQLSAKLEHVGIDEVIKIIETWSDKSLYYDVIGDAMCIMHDDGSVNIIEHTGNGAILGEVISAENILKVLHYYRPFKDVFKSNIN